MEILRGIWAVELSKADGLDNKAYITGCTDGVVLIDTGYTKEDIESISRELLSMGRTWDDVKIILITHEHGDHIENLAALKDLTDAQVMVGEGDVSGVESQTGIEVDRSLRHGDFIQMCGGIEAIHVSGHSVGNLSFYLQKQKVIIAGDTIFGDDNGILHPPPEKYSLDARMAEAGIKRLLFYDFDALLLAHRKNVLKNAKGRVRTLCEGVGF